MSYLMVTTKAVADAIRDRRVAAVKIAYNGEEVILWDVSNAITRLHQGIVFYTREGEVFEEHWSHELAVTGWL